MTLGIASCTQNAPPALLADALKLSPELCLLDWRTDLKGSVTAAEAKELDLWPPWLITDLDRDGKPDVAAIVVRRGKDGTKFGVIAIHARQPLVIHWVAELQDHVIYRIATLNEKKPDRILVEECVYCDANTWARWTGDSYQWEAYLAGDQLFIADEAEAHREPSIQSERLWPIKPCTAATVIASKGTKAGDRWYFIEIAKTKLRGWVRDEALSDDCFSPTSMPQSPRP